MNQEKRRTLGGNVKSAQAAGPEAVWVGKLSLLIFKKQELLFCLKVGTVLKAIQNISKMGSGISHTPLNPTQRHEIFQNDKGIWKIQKLGLRFNFRNQAWF